MDGTGWKFAIPVGCAVYVRYLLFYLLGESLEQRVELSNAFNGFRGIREASALLHYGSSPYSGSGVRTPPLAITMLQPFVNSLLAPVPFIAADVLSACLAYGLARHVLHAPVSKHVGLAAQKTMIITPQVVAYAFLWNPLTVLTCSSLSTAALMQSSLLMAAYGAAVLRSPAITALGCAVAAYLDIYTLIFALPLISILLKDVEDVLKQPCSNCLQTANSESVDVASKLVPWRCDACGSAMKTHHTLRGKTAYGSQWSAAAQLWQFVVVFCMCALSLTLLSDALVLSWSTGQCLAWLQSPPSHTFVPETGSRISQQAWFPAWIMTALASIKQVLCIGEHVLAKYLKGHGFQDDSQTATVHSPDVRMEESCSNWMWKSYGGTIVYDDLSPNIGVWWYFTCEMFQEFRSFFKFVLHSEILLFALPITVRFRHRPLFAFFLHAMLVATFKPFPVAADVALYLNLLPVFTPALKWAQPGLMLGFIMLLAAVMGPATLYQWLHTGSANSNFFYAMTLLWAGAQVLLMLLLTYSVKQQDVDLQQKPQRFKLSPIMPPQALDSATS